MAKKYQGIPQDEEALTGATAHVKGAKAEGGNKATDDQPGPESTRRSIYPFMFALFFICSVIIILFISFELYEGKIGCEVKDKPPAFDLPTNEPKESRPTITQGSLTTGLFPVTAQPSTPSSMAYTSSTTSPPTLNYSLLVTESGLCLTGGITPFADICRGDGDQLWALHQGLLLNERTGECLAGDGMRRKLHLKARNVCTAPNHCLWHHGNGKVGCGGRCLDEGNTYAGLPVVLRPCWEANHWVIG